MGLFNGFSFLVAFELLYHVFGHYFVVINEQEASDFGFLNSSSLHGVRYVTGVTVLPKILWALLIAVSIGISMWLAITGIKEQDLQIVFSGEKDGKDLFSLNDLPSVTLCAKQDFDKWQYVRIVLNQFNHSHLSDNDVSNELRLAVNEFMKLFAEFQWVALDAIQALESKEIDQLRENILSISANKSIMKEYRRTIYGADKGKLKTLRHLSSSF